MCKLTPDINMVEFDPESWTISPSQYITFNSCEYLWYQEKVMKRRGPGTMYTLRGSAWHLAAELLWRYTTADHAEDYKQLNGPESPDDEQVVVEELPFFTECIDGDMDPFIKGFREYGIKCFNDAWKTIGDSDEPTETLLEYHELYDTSLATFMRYVDENMLSMMVYIMEKNLKPKDAYFKVRPFLRESRWYTNSGTEMGIIDQVLRFGGGDIISDFKTSKPGDQESFHSEEYVEQIAYYAHIYQDRNGFLPKWGEIYYVLYNMRVRYAINQAMVDEVRTGIKAMRQRIQDFKDGHKPVKNTKYRYCKWCYIGENGFCDRNTGQTTL